MQQIRPDIGDAVSRMHVTFGTRSSIRNLHKSLEPGELVQAMVACFYSGSDGLLVLTDRRVIAVRDDFSRFRLQAVPLVQVQALDYAPTVHDGLAVLTDTGRIAVRKMNRQDSDAFAAALVSCVPGLIVGASRPQNKETFHPDPSTGLATDATAQGEAAAAAGAAGLAAAAQGDPQGGDGDRSTGAGAPLGSLVGSQGAAPAAGTDAAGTFPAGRAATPAAPDAQAAPVSTAEPHDSQADREVLLGVLADLHAKGLLSGDELAAKIAKLTSSP